MLGGISDRKGWHLVSIGGEKSVILSDVQSAWEWRDGRWRPLKIHNGFVTLSAGHGYFIYKEKGTAIAVSVDMTDFQFSHYDDGRFSSASAKFGNETMTVSVEEVYELKESTSHDINFLLLKDLLLTKYASQKASAFGKENSEQYQNAYNSIIRSLMVKTEDNMQNIAGEVVEIGDDLYANDGESLIKLHISAERYLSLFPPFLRYCTEQGGLADCAVVAGLISAIHNPRSFAKLLSLFSEDENNNLTVKFYGFYGDENFNGNSVTFENSEIPIGDGLINGEVKTVYIHLAGGFYYSTDPPDTMTLTGCDGAKFLEQAYIIAEYANGFSHPIEIEDVDIDAAKLHTNYGYNTQQFMVDAFCYNEISRSLGSKNDLDYDSSIFGNMSDEKIAQYKEDIKNYIDTCMKISNCYADVQNLLGDKKYEIFCNMDVEYNCWYNDFPWAYNSWWSNHRNKDKEHSIWEVVLKDDGSVDIDFLREKEKKLLYDPEERGKITDLEYTKITYIMNSNNYYNYTVLYYEVIEAREKFLQHIKENNDSEAIYDFAGDIMDYSYLPDDMHKILNSFDTVGLAQTVVNMPNYVKENRHNFLDFLAEKAANGDFLMLVSDSGHAYTVERIDKKNKMITVKDPRIAEFASIYSYDDFFKRFRYITIGFINSSLYDEHLFIPPRVDR